MIITVHVRNKFLFFFLIKISQVPRYEGGRGWGEERERIGILHDIESVDSSGIIVTTVGFNSCWFTTTISWKLRVQTVQITSTRRLSPH
jgi:hypothetical protein